MRVDPPAAHVHLPSRYSLIWLVPLIAAGLAIYLAWATLAARGPLITITFSDGKGLTPGETKVKYKGVAIGTVEAVSLSDHGEQVAVSVRMAKSAAPMLATHAQFWIVRPEFSLTSLSGLETLMSGSCVAVDPGPRGGKTARNFVTLTHPRQSARTSPGPASRSRRPVSDGSMLARRCSIATSPSGR